MPTTRVSARERLLETADRLFYAEGVQTVGIDRILEESGVAKASLYKHFGSKQALVAAYLERRHAAIAGRIALATAAAATPRERILAVFAAQARAYARPGFHGCAFAAADAEAEPGGLVDTTVQQYRAWLRDLFRDLGRDLGAWDPEALAVQLQALYDGAALAARSGADVSDSIRAAVVAVLDGAAPDAPDAPDALVTGRSRTR